MLAIVRLDPSWPGGSVLTIDEPAGRRLSRRGFLVASGGGLALATLSGCATPASPLTTEIRPDGPEVLAAEDRRKAPGAPVVSYTLRPAPTRIDLGGPVVDTWAYGATVPGAMITANVGQLLDVVVQNGLPDPTSVHWHGLALRNDMDGVPGLSQPRAIASGKSMTYRFALAHSGTYWFHPHVGTQLDRGLYAPLVIQDPDEVAAYDLEHVVVCDDWLDGTGLTPDDVLGRLRSAGMDMGSEDRPSSDALGGDAGDVEYPFHLVNGRVASAPLTFDAEPGQRVRLRLINAGGDTAFRVALGGHRMLVTHTDGFPITPAEGDAVLLGMGERIDAVVTLQDGVFPLVALAEGKNMAGMELIRTGSGAAPTADVRPRELTGTVLTVDDFRATDEVLLPEKRLDRTHDLELGGGMDGYRWTINGRTYDQAQPLPLRGGERVRLKFVNRTTMFHPMHVHGHTFQIRTPNGEGPRKDTVIVRPRKTIVADLVADNPGQWLVHCHNIYHGEAGMMTSLSYVR